MPFAPATCEIVVTSRQTGRARCPLPAGAYACACAAQFVIAHAGCNLQRITVDAYWHEVHEVVPFKITDTDGTGPPVRPVCQQFEHGAPCSSAATAPPPIRIWRLARRVLGGVFGWRSWPVDLHAWTQQNASGTPSHRQQSANCWDQLAASQSE